MIAIRSNNVSLKYQRFTSYGCKDTGFTKTEVVAKDWIPLLHFEVLKRKIPLYDIMVLIKLLVWCRVPHKEWDIGLPKFKI